MRLQYCGDIAWDTVMAQSLVVAVGNIKGGVGKTTLAVNLAVSQALRGGDILLVDGDERAFSPRLSPRIVTVRTL
jgi:Mrp family chromosome partitioning ATPase